MSQSNYMRAGWAVSVGLHVLLAVVFFLIIIPIKPFVEEFAELYFQTIPASPARVKAAPSSSTPPARVAPAADKAEPKDAAVSSKADPGTLVDLPQRRYMREDELSQPVPEPTRKPETGKTDAEEVVRSVSIPSMEDRGKALPAVQPGARETPSIDRLLAAGPRPDGPTITETPLGGASQQPFEILWEGPSREILSGPLPEYPKGISKEVKIRLEFQVHPDGTVGMISPVTKGETTLENTAMEALKQWRFNPLDSSQPRVIQTAVITFVLKLE